MTHVVSVVMDMVYTAELRQGPGDGEIFPMVRKDDGHPRFHVTYEVPHAGPATSEKSVTELYRYFKHDVETNRYLYRHIHPITETERPAA